jgi:class 3 adenylate cyclase/tetratricopeptide (TPR) repeat protein
VAPEHNGAQVIGRSEPIPPWSAYVPRLFLRDIVQRPTASPAGTSKRIEAAVLFADISGFTAMSEALGRKGRFGTEELRRLLNDCFARITDIALAYGGDVAKFGGDSMTTLFPFGEAPKDPVRRAVQAANDMQSAMRRFADVETSAGVFTLSMRMGLGLGPLLCVVVGDPAVRLEHIVAGRGLDLAVAAQRNARTGEVVAHQTAVDLCDDVEVIETRREFVSIGGLEGKAPDTVPVEPARTTVDVDRILASFLHPFIARRIRAGQIDLVDEHRQVTTLFVGFIGPDYDKDLHAGIRLQRYFSDVLPTVARHGGHLGQIEMGDKGSKYIVVLGAPALHEDDIERGLNCAIDLANIPDAVTRIGVTTGLVFCGHVGSASRREYTVMGTAVNLSARLMEAGKWNEVLVDEDVRLSASNTFTWGKSTQLPLKGTTLSVKVSVLDSRRAARARAHQRKYTGPLVGRRDEVELMLQEIDHASAGQGRVVAISGAPGVGKSRLVDEIAKVSVGRGFEVLYGTCEPRTSNTSYSVWRDVWRGFFDVDVNWSVDRQVDQLDRVVAQLGEDLFERIPLLAPVLDIRIPQSQVVDALDFDSRSESLKAFLLECLRRRSRHKPIVIVLEDCHWIDFLSNDLLGFIGRNIVFLPVVVLLTYREGMGVEVPPQEVRVAHHFVELPLEELTAEHAEELIHLRLQESKVGGAAPTTDVLHRIQAIGGGNPFYIEELMHFLVLRGVDLGNANALDKTELPASLRNLIMTRIDQLSEGEKAVIKVASAIGRVFKASWVAGSYPKAGTALAVKQHLRRLDRHDLTLLHNREPELEYIFKHAITQEVAYNSLPFAMRETLHTRVAQFVERTYSEDLDQYVEVLAHHYGQTRNVDKQRIYFRRAADKAKSSFANDTAINFYERLLPLEDARGQLDITLSLADLWALVGDWNRAEQLYRKVVALAGDTNDLQLTAESKSALGYLLCYKENCTLAVPWLRDARRGFEELGDSRGLAKTLGHLSQASLELGDHVRTLDYADQQMRIAAEESDPISLSDALETMGLALWDRDRQRALELFHQQLNIATDAGYTKGVIDASNNIAGIYSELGNGERAMTYLQQALEIALRIGYQHTAARLVGNAGLLYRNHGDYSHASACLERSLEMTLELGDKRSVCNQLGELGILRTAEGDYEQANALLQRAISLGRFLANAYYTSTFLYHQAELRRRQEQFSESLALAREALSISSELNHVELRLRSDVLVVILEVALQLIDKADATSRLHALIPLVENKNDEAMIQYELWQLDGSVATRNEAARILRSLYDQTSWATYRRLYEELTSEVLPDPSRLPVLPEAVTQPRIELEALLRQVDDMLKSAAATAA